MNQKEYETVLSENYKLSKRVSELEQQKAELITYIKNIHNQTCREDMWKISDEVLKKYSGE